MNLNIARRYWTKGMVRESDRDTAREDYEEDKEEDKEEDEIAERREIENIPLKVSFSDTQIEETTLLCPSYDRLWYTVSKRGVRFLPAWNTSCCLRATVCWREDLSPRGVLRCRETYGLYHLCERSHV